MPCIKSEFGEFVKDYLNKYPKAETKTFCKWAYNFVMRVLIEMKERFDNFQNPFYLSVVFLKPENATSEKYHATNSEIFERLLNVNRRLITDENHRDTLMEQWKIIPV